MVCAVENMGNSLAKKKQENVDDESELALVAEKARKQVAVSEARERLRKKHVKRPEGADAKDAEAWAAQRIIELLPDAVAEVEYQLRFGDDAQRAAMARDVLDANGMRRKEALQGGGQTIILNMNAALPWAQKVAIDAVVSAREVGSSEKEAVRKRLPEQLGRLVDVDPGREPASEGEVD